MIWPKARSAPLSSDVRNFVEQGQQLGNIVTVCLGQNAGQWDAVGIGEHMVFASQFAPIRGIWAGFCASAGCAHRGAIHEGAIPIDLVSCLEFRKQVFENALPNACFLPLPEVAPARLSAGEIAGRRKPAPGNARAENEEDTGKHPARLGWFSSSEPHMSVLLRLRDQRFQAIPEIVRQNGTGHEEDLLCGLPQTPADAMPNQSGNA